GGFPTVMAPRRYSLTCPDQPQPSARRQRRGAFGSSGCRQITTLKYSLNVDDAAPCSRCRRLGLVWAGNGSKAQRHQICTVNKLRIEAVPPEIRVYCTSNARLRRKPLSCSGTTSVRHTPLLAMG